MAADEEVNTTNLDALKSALEDLKIVDVERKPAAVPADLRVRKIDEETVDDAWQSAVSSCVPDSEDPNGPLEILSNSGDISLQLADGARYILRFGSDDRRVFRRRREGEEEGRCEARQGQTRRKTIPRPAWTATCS